MYLRTALAQSVPNSAELRRRPKGEMAEWSIVAVSKAVELQGSGGSNPSLSAKEVSVVANEVTALAFMKWPRLEYELAYPILRHSPIRCKAYTDPAMLWL